MDNRRHGREAWTQFDDFVVGQPPCECTLLQEDSSADPTLSNTAHSKRVQTDSHTSLAPVVVPSTPIMSFSHQPTGLSTIASTRSAFNAQVSSDSITSRTDIWSISPEQRAYYLSQFLRLQSDPRAKLSGSQAKMFFELSKLPTAELSDIWELSDTDRDGQLTLGEFTVAMHLVVLRRNGIPVPHALPDRLLEVVHTQSVSTFMLPPINQVANTNEDIKNPSTIRAISQQHSKINDWPHTDRTDGPMLLSHNRPWHGSPAWSSAVLTPGSGRQRRWSISSQSDISSLAEGIMHFESKPNVDVQLQHPIPIRARTLPMDYSGLDVGAYDKVDCQPFGTTAQLIPKGVDTVGMLISCCSKFPQCGSGHLPESMGLSPPPPPPRARTASRRWEIKIDSLNPVVKDGSKFLEENSFVGPSNLPDCVDPQSVISELREKCDDVMRTNDHLASELMQLQQHRIALKILLERLMPLESSVCSS